MSTRDAIYAVRSDSAIAGTSNTIHQAFGKKRKVATDSNQADESRNLQLPSVQVNNVTLESESTETIMINPSYNSKEKEYLAFKLNKLNDKKARFQSHESYLKKCLDNNLIPNGLKVYVEPSIGNRDDDFLTKWHNRLEEFSKTLTNDVVGFCEEELNKTNQEIVDISQRLQSQTSTIEFDKLTEAIDINQSIRERDLQQRKNRKFYGLKYKNKPNNRNAYNQSETRPATGYNQETMRREKTNERNIQWNNGKGFEDTRHDYANAVKQPQQKTITNNGNQLGRNNSYGRFPRNRPSQRHLKQVFNNTNKESEASSSRATPLTERISLRSLHRRSERNLPRETTTTTEQDSRNKEIEELRKRLNDLETKDETVERVVQHEIIQQDDNEKNLNTAQRMEMGTNNNDITEMKKYLKSVMETISGFDKQLTIQLNTGSIPSERL